MTKVAVIDDVLLARVIAAGDPATVIEGATAVSSGMWWYRLARAVLRDETDGNLSRWFRDVDHATRLRLLTSLPRGVSIRGLTTLAPTAAEIAADASRRGVRLNALAAEAVAVVTTMSASLHVATPSPSLAAASDLYDFSYDEIN